MESFGNRFDPLWLNTENFFFNSTPVLFTSESPPPLATPVTNSCVHTLNASVSK